MSLKKKVAYYNMPGDIAYEKELLNLWKIDDIELYQVKGANIEESIADYDGLVTEYTRISEEVLSRLPKLKIISLQSIGYDEIDTGAARRYGVDVTNAPGYCAEDVATHALSLLLAITRQLQVFDRDIQSGEWNTFAGQKMHRLSGKTAGLVSFGNIPQKMVKMLQGFGIKVLAFDPAKDKQFMEGFGVEKCDTLEMLLQQSDFVFLHTPLNPDTYHMINKSNIGNLKDGAILINVARGPLVEEKALTEALKSGKLYAAGLDVLEEEICDGREIFSLPNVLITPHSAFLSDDSLKQSRKMALSQLIQRLVNNKTPEYLVN